MTRGSHSQHAKTCLMSYANNKGADQPAHLRSLISTFFVRCLDSMICIHTCYMQSLRILASFCSWAGWFESYLVKNLRRHFRMMWLNYDAYSFSRFCIESCVQNHVYRIMVWCILYVCIYTCMMYTKTRFLWNSNILCTFNSFQFNPFNHRWGSGWRFH